MSDNLDRYQNNNYNDSLSVYPYFRPHEIKQEKRNGRNYLTMDYHKASILKNARKCIFDKKTTSPPPPSPLTT